MIKMKVAIIFNRRRASNAGCFYVPVGVNIGTYNKEKQTFIASESGIEYKKVSPDLEVGYSLLYDVNMLVLRYGCYSVSENIRKYFAEACNYLYCSSNENQNVSQGGVHYYSINPLNGLVRAMDRIDTPPLISIDPSLCYAGEALFAHVQKPNILPGNNTVKKVEDILFRYAELNCKLKERVKGQDPFIDYLVSTLRNNEQVANLPVDFASAMKHIFECGPTGCGKTHVFKVLDKLYNKPIIRTAANDYTINGYVGEDVVNMLKNLYIKAKNDINLAQTGAIFMDEFDKLIEVKDDGVVSGVQNSLLTMLSGEVKSFIVGGRNGMSVDFDTKYVTFILGGSFERLYKERNSQKLGFGVNNGGKKSNYQFTDEELINFGVRPEILGRCGKVQYLNPLTYDNLVDILINDPYNDLNAKVAILALSNIKLTYKEDFILYIAKLAQASDYGARNIQKLVESTFKGIDQRLGIAPETLIGKEIEITPETVNDPQKYFVR